ncbi:MAG: hypothetical protein AB1393_02575 [Candidatus Edwardsbacteria bacterium]
MNRHFSPHLRPIAEIVFLAGIEIGVRHCAEGIQHIAKFIVNVRLNHRTISIRHPNDRTQSVVVVVVCFSPVATLMRASILSLVGQIFFFHFPEMRLR